MIDELNNWIGLVAAIFFAVVTAGYFYMLGKRTRDPSWAIRSNNIIRGFESQLLDISYSGHPVETLTISKILFWNHGKQSIRGNAVLNGGDISEPVRIVCLTGQILDSTVLQRSNTAIKFSATVSPDKKSAELSFLYLDQGDGAVIQVIHTGTSSSDLQIEGRIMETKRIRLREVDIGSRAKALLGTGIIFALFSAAALIFLFDPEGTRSQQVVDQSAVFIGAIAIEATGLVVCGAFVLRDLRRRIPSGLALFAGDFLGGDLGSPQQIGTGTRGTIT